MKGITNPIALRALQQAMTAAKFPPTPRPVYSSRTADKFVIRGYPELFTELSAIGRHQGRSMNSEVVAAILDALAGNVRSTAALKVHKAYLTAEVSAQVLEAVPEFKVRPVGDSRKAPKFVVRFPPSIRDAVKEQITAVSFYTSMNTWCLMAIEKWINIQRQQYALLSAVIAMDHVMGELE